MRLSFSIAVAIAVSIAFVHAAPVIPLAEVRSKAAQGLRLLELAEDADPVWKTEDEKVDLIKAGVHFVCLFILY